MTTDVGAAGSGRPSPGHARGPTPLDTGRHLNPALVLLVGWSALFPFTRHYGNPDGTAYGALARLWLDGDWSTAVNGYWGPALSWLMTPLMALGVPSLLALRLVLLAGALAALPPLRRLCQRAGASSAATDTTLVAVAFFLVYATLFGLYPDVLLAAALLRVCDHLFRPEFRSGSRTALIAGAWGGAAYLVKAYAVPVVLVLVPVAVVLHVVTAPGQRVAATGRQAGLTLAAFGVVFAAWAGTLSAAHGEPTFSTSAGFNSRLAAPGSAGNPLNHPGLHLPPGDGAVSVWEEPSRLAVPARTQEQGGSQVGGDVDALVERVRTWYGNARVVAGSMVRRGLPLAVLALVALAWFAHRRRLPPLAVTGTLAAGAVSAGGLVLIIAIERYLWFPVLSCAPAAALGLTLVQRRWSRTGVVAAGLLVVTMAGSSLHGLLPRWGADREVTAVTRALQDQGGLEGTVATTDPDWARTLMVCYQVGCQYVGRPTSATAPAIAAELRADGVDRLLVWGDTREPVPGLPLVARAPLLTVYEVTPDGLVPGPSVADDPA